MELYTFVSFDSTFSIVMICDKANNWLALAKGDKTAHILAFLKLDKASSLNLRGLNLPKISSECLKSKLEPALVNILYSGLN